MVGNIDAIDMLHSYSITQPTSSTRQLDRLLFYLLVKYITESKKADPWTSPYCDCVELCKGCYCYSKR